VKTYLQLIGRFLLLLLVIQIIRGLIITGMWKVFRPAFDSPTWAYMDMIAFTLVGVALLLFFRPSGIQLALEWRSASRRERVIYLGMGTLTLALVGTSYFIQPALLLINISTAIVLPLFEELLFRGWGWTQLEQAATFKNSRLINWLVISILFGLWHFGYMDIYLLKMAPANPGMDWGIFFVMKFLTTFIIGIVVGIPRWRTGRVYGSFILHALINIFGR
jgi:hypothetical protein